MPQPLAIFSKHCWLDGRFHEATIFAEGGTINRIEPGMADAPNLVDVGNMVLMPGAIDAHVHINEPGRTEWEGFDTATQAAAAGGITTLIEMPLNADPVTTTVDALARKVQATENKLHVNCGFYGGLIPGNYNELEGLLKGGVFGIKAFLTHSGIEEFPNVTENDLRAAMPLLAKYDMPLLVHCELTDKDHLSALQGNSQSYKAYLQSRPKEWENKAVQLVVDLCREYRCPVHIVHVSSADALQIIAKAKQDGLPVTAETCPHYLLFAAEEIPDADCLFKCAPPIREAGNNLQLKKAFSTGVLDFLASDHSPAPPDIKEITSGNLLKAWGGIAGLQFLLTAGWTSLKDVISLDEFIPLLTENPAKFLQLDYRKGHLKVGFDADLVVWDPEEKFMVQAENIFHRHKGTPYAGKQLYGKIKRTYVGGELVFENNSILEKNKGQWLKR